MKISACYRAIADLEQHGLSQFGDAVAILVQCDSAEVRQKAAA